MKKVYIKPETEVCNVAPVSIIAASIDNVYFEQGEQIDFD